MTDSFVKLLTAIDEDKSRTGSYARYPVRFIFFSETKPYIELTTYLLGKGAQLIQLADLLKKPDGWISHSMLFNIINQNLINKDLVLCGFSELTRFYKRNELETLILSLITDIENNRDRANRRIYIPCLGMYDYFYSVCAEKYNRLQFYNPLICATNYREQPLKFFSTTSELVTDIKLIKLDTVSEWLSIWKTISGLESPMVCTSKTLHYWYENAKPDTVFEIEKLVDERDVLKHIFGIDISCEYDPEEKSYWAELLKHISEVGVTSLDELLEKSFGVSNIFSTSLVKLWFSEKSRYKKWLLKLFALEFGEKAGLSEYHRRILRNLKQYEDESYARAIWIEILDANPTSPEWFSQRKELIGEVAKYYNKFDSFEAGLQKKLDLIEDVDILLKVLTGVTRPEKERAITLFKDGKITINDLLRVYPDFAAYLLVDRTFDNVQDVSWVKDYFYAYRFAKLKDVWTDELREMLIEKNGDSDRFYKWYYTVPLVSELLASQKVDRVVLLDGVGAEWFNLLIKLLSDKRLHINQAFVARSELPSTTKFNKIIGAEHIKGFDGDIIHDLHYKSPGSLVRAIDYIGKLVDDKIFVEQDERVAVIADHGCTAVHRFSHATKLYDFSDAEHDGRCMNCQGKEVAPKNDYVIYKQSSGDQWILALREVSLYKRSAYEVHGGATPEEVIVPVIIVSNEPGGNIIYKVNALKLKITGLDRRVQFKITPRPNVPPKLVDKSGKAYLLVDKGTFWEAQIDNIEKQTVSVIVGEKSTKFQVVTSFEEGDLF